MKNIQILPTSQPSNLLLCIKSYIEHKDTPAENSDNKGNFTLGFGIYANTEFYQHQHIYITSAEEIKVGDWYYLPRTNSVYKCIEDPTELNLERRLGVAKIILTTDQDLIKDGVQAIDDEFLEWFVKNPSCESVEVADIWKMGIPSTHDSYQLIIPKEEQKQHLIDMMRNDEELGLYEEPKTKCYCGHTTTCDCGPEQYFKDIEFPQQERPETLEEFEKAALKYNEQFIGGQESRYAAEDFINGAKWQQERSYSEEEVFNILIEFSSIINLSFSKDPEFIFTWVEQFKKK
jgi:hypothetical protein